MRWSPNIGTLDRQAGFPRVVLRFLISCNLVKIWFHVLYHDLSTMKQILCIETGRHWTESPFSFKDLQLVSSQLATLSPTPIWLLTMK
jgi:hypothetical protein